MFLKMLVLALTVIAGEFFVTFCFAHPKLTAADPTADAVESSSPTEIRLTFNEGLTAKFSDIELRDQRGQRVKTGPATIDASDKKQLVIPISAPLPEGTYTVNWYAVGADTHRVQGRFSFAVKH
jgi:methionine-rich copper-binding protein CopC